MKNQIPIIFAAATAAVALSIAPASALAGSVGYRAVGDDGIAASPKARQILDERARSAALSQTSATASVGFRAVANDGIAASPRLRQMLAERPHAAATTPATALAACSNHCCDACGK